MKQIVDDIQKYSADDYRTIINDFVTFFSLKYGNKISLYQIGSAGFPSVSDLDLAVIIDELKVDQTTMQAIIKDANEFVYQNEARRYIFTHSILKYPVKTFAYRQYFEFAPSVTLLYGDEVALKTREEDRDLIDDLMFIVYEANTIRDFERLWKKKTVGLREVLKVYQRAYYHFQRASYAQNRNMDTSEMSRISEYAKQIRLEATHKTLDKKYETSLIALFDELYKVLRLSYRNHMGLLSEKITGKRFDREVFVFGSGGIVKQPLFLLYMGALYAREYAKARNCYADIHRLMYPLDISGITFDPRFVQMLAKQAEILEPVCSFYRRFGTKVSGPMLCYYCRPEVSWKLRVRYALQKQLYRLQGVKTV
jgi:hypothetical protein